MSKEERISDDLLEKCGRELADHLLDSATRGTVIQMNNQIDILRTAAILILGIDLANSIHSFDLGIEDVNLHLSHVSEAVREESIRMLTAIKQGTTEHRIPHQRQ